MPGEVWGTFAVNDHCRPKAFAREVLLFDRLVVPVPAHAKERERWRQPNPRRPQETWDPDRLDRLLSVLGTQAEAGYNGARLVQASPWDEQRWRFEKSRAEVAETITNRDAFYTTRTILAHGDSIPAVVEAIAAFPSASRCRDELRPLDQPPPDLTAARALVMLARPFVVPGVEGDDELDTLRAAADLAREPDFKAARTAYHDWLRGFVAPLQAPGARLEDVRLDPASLRLAQERLKELVAAERRAIEKVDARKRWTVTEYAMTVVSVGTAVGLALVNPLAGIGVLGAVAGFGGWLAGKRAEPPQPRPLGGASLFVEAQQRLAWAGAPGA